jgi:hypothetical protein
MTRIWEFKTANFKVVVSAETEHCIDLSWDESGEATHRIETGEWEVFCATVRVFYRGAEMATEYLGNCIYADPKDFRDHVGSKGKWGSYFTQMVKDAIHETRQNLLNAPRLRAA